MKKTMMAVLLMGMLALTGLASADTYKTIYNPFTSKLDYVSASFSNLTINGSLVVTGNATATWFLGLFNWTENSPYLDFTGGYLLSFNETKLNSTITSLDRDTFWNITGSPYLYNNSGILSVNETKMNATIDAREIDTRWTINAPYLYNNSGNLDVNETKLNATIDAREIDTRWSLTGQYLYNNSGSLDVNETKLNTTVSGSATFVKIAGDTMTGALNMSTHNVTDVDCIRFSAGGMICNSP